MLTNEQRKRFSEGAKAFKSMSFEDIKKVIEFERFIRNYLKILSYANI